MCTLEVDPDDTILCVKEKVKEKERLQGHHSLFQKHNCLKHFYILFAGKTLIHLNKTLKEYNIQKESTLEIYLGVPDISSGRTYYDIEIKILFKHFVLYYRINKTDTIKQIKDMLKNDKFIIEHSCAGKYLLDPDSYNLQYVMRDDTKLNRVSVNDGDIFVFVRRLKK
jgi:hypothetical protein